MRIGILTLPLHVNYGGILQAYALQTVLERMGHDVVVFHREATEKSWKTPSFPLKLVWRGFKKTFINHNTLLFRERETQKRRPFYERKIKQFTQEYIKTYTIRSLSELNESNFDALVVGSDQIWRPIYIKNWDTPVTDAFFGFARNWNVRRIAYAPSFGVSDFEYEEKDIPDIRELLQKFNAISVREQSGVTLCKKFFHAEAKHVLDPTMLLSANDYQALFKKKSITKSRGNMCVYILDSTHAKERLVERIAREKSLTPNHVNADILKDAGNEQTAKLSIEEWLRGFYDAEFVITDSFHACVFSILFGKPFLAIANKGRGIDRFQSLLSTFGLENNLIFDVSEYNPDRIYTVSSECQHILDKMRIDSMNFLKNSLV